MMNGTSNQLYVRITFIMVLLSLSFRAAAQDDKDYKYERNSLCIMMIEHPNLAFNEEIKYVFSTMDVPHRFNDHSLGVRAIKFAEDKDQVKNIQSFCKQVMLGKRVIAKWFNRDKESGCFDMELIKERGNYSATVIDVNLAKSQTRNLALLEDAGEHLISHTYLVISDIYYIDKSNKWQILKEGLNFAGNMVQQVQQQGNTPISQNDDPFGSSTYSWMYEDLMDNIKGFRVKITSYLFRLQWNDEIAGQFYDQYYTEDATEADKIKAFLSKSVDFNLEYVGEVSNSSSKSQLYGVKTNEQLIRKVCIRALDKNLADLQHTFSDFRIKAPLIETSPLKAYVGMKEDIDEKSRFEVLEKIINENGRSSYKRVATIKPVKDKIWDNRYMAAEEQAQNADLKATEFAKVSGGDILSGMLIREIK